MSTDFSGCPKLFIMLPVNKDGVSFDKDHKLFASSLVFDGYAAHMLCEFPDGYHLTRSPGYRLRQPKDFAAKFGSHAITVLRMFSHMAESTVSARHASSTKAVSQCIGDLIKDITTKFPSIKDTTAKSKPEQLASHILERSKKFKREDLRKFLHIVDKPDVFGPLRRLVYGDQFLWLCSDHYKQLKVLSIGTIGPHTHKESLA